MKHPLNKHYVMHYTISSLYTVKKDYLSIKGTMFHFTRISLYKIYLEKQKKIFYKIKEDILKEMGFSPPPECTKNIFSDIPPSGQKVEDVLEDIRSLFSLICSVC